MEDAMETELVQLSVSEPKALFSPGGLETFLASIEHDARALVADVNTSKGQKAIASNAARVSKAKVYLDGIGKKYVAELKALPKAVDKERKNMRDRLDALRDEVRRPLTDLENKEKERIAAHVACMSDIAIILPEGVLPTKETIHARIEYLEELTIGPDWEEYKSDAEQTRQATLYQLQGMLREIVDRELKEETERRDREKKIAENARIEAEAAAKLERERMEREHANALEREQIALERTKLAEENAKNQAKLAAQLERDRIETQARKEIEEKKRREADKNHRARINSKAAAEIAECAAISIEQARSVVAAIIREEIANISISY